MLKAIHAQRAAKPLTGRREPSSTICAPPIHAPVSSAHLRALPITPFPSTAENPHQQSARASSSDSPRHVLLSVPHGQSCLNLAAARLRYIAPPHVPKCYMNMRPLYQPQVMQTGASPDQMCTHSIIHIANHPTDASCIFEAARAHL